MINQALFPVYIGSIKGLEPGGGGYLKDLFLSTFLNVLTFYAVYFALPPMYSSRSKVLGALVTLGLIGIFTFLRFGISWLVFNHSVFFRESGMHYSFSWIWNELRLSVISAIYAVLIRFLIRAFEARQLYGELVNQRQVSELALIKAKVNPHFLFNTLNNIYSLVYKKSDEAPEAIMKFSSIMRFVLNEANSEFIMLDKEIEYMKSYIELQKLRINKPGYVDMQIRGITGGKTIAPMLLIPLVENAFKHGSKKFEPGVQIRLNIENDSIDFEVKNHLKENQPLEAFQFGALGLDNIRRRLELTYPGKHHFTVRREQGMFIVNLIIKP